MRTNKTLAKVLIGLTLITGLAQADLNNDLCKIHAGKFVLQRTTAQVLEPLSTLTDGSEMCNLTLDILTTLFDAKKVCTDAKNQREITEEIDVWYKKGKI